MTVIRWFGVIVAAAWLLEGVATAGQATPAPPVRDPDRNVNLSQPDFTIVTLPTTLRLPRHRSAFRVTHRFGRPLGAGKFGDLAGDLLASIQAPSSASSTGTPFCAVRR